MDCKHSILVIEDDPFHIENLYKYYLGSLDADIEYAQSKIEAIEKVRCRTYTIAFVDIMLREDQIDRGGVEVIKYMHHLNEGTAIIVVSATDDIEVALVTHKAGIVDFIRKENIHTKKDLLEPVEKILNNYDLYNLNYLGRFTRLSAYLASPELTPYWEHTIMTALGVSYEVMLNTLNNTLKAFLPILRKKDSRYTLKTDSKNQCVNGVFWSKGVGSPIWYSVANQGGILIEPPDNLRGDILYEDGKGKLKTTIWKLISVKRSEFSDSVWDEVK